MHLFVLLLMLLAQLNCGLQFLENKILFVSLASAINIRDNLLIELDTPSIDIFAVLLDVAKLHYSAKVDLAAYFLCNSVTLVRLTPIGVFTRADTPPPYNFVNIVPK